MLFDEDFYLKEQAQDEFRGLEAYQFISMDLGSHFKEMQSKKGKTN